MSLSEQQKRFWLTPGNTIPCTLEVVNDAVNVIYELNTQLALAAEREERYRKALEEITKLNTEGVTEASIIARTALDEGKEVK